jgi:hypothetical protein
MHSFGMPIWYNNAKSKKPRKQGFAGLALFFFHPIPNPKRADLATLKKPTLINAKSFAQNQGGKP